MSVQSFQRVIRLLIGLILATSIVLLPGCATTAPVQEMSNARQTIASAREVKAEIYSPENLKAAEKLMEQATEALKSGDYETARESAVAAQQYAIKARQQAISHQK